jgi:hypothetical protein
METNDLETLFKDLTQAHRVREDIMKPRIMVGNLIKSMGRMAKRREIELDLDDAPQYTFFDENEKEWSKTMIGIVKRMPCHDWWVAIHGCSSLGLAMLLGETGDLSKYASPAKVWRRMGLDVMNGEANKNRFKGMNTGYSKRRRMIAFRVSSAIVKANSGHYREVYDIRKGYEAERDSKGYNANYVKAREQFMLDHYKTSKDKIKAGRLPQCIIDLRAHRYMVKRLIADLWMEWNRRAETLPIKPEWRMAEGF